MGSPVGQKLKIQRMAKGNGLPGIVKKIVNDQDGLFGALVVLNPTVANFIKEAGYDTVEKFTQYLLAPAEGQATPEPAAQGERAGLRGVCR